MLPFGPQTACDQGNSVGDEWVVSDPRRAARCPRDFENAVRGRDCPPQAATAKPG